jgi:hypothetical protein
VLTFWNIWISDSCFPTGNSYTFEYINLAVIRCSYVHNSLGKWPTRIKFPAIFKFLVGLYMTVILQYFQRGHKMELLLPTSVPYFPTPGLLFYPKDGSSMFLRKAGRFLLVYRTAYPPRTITIAIRTHISLTEESPSAVGITWYTSSETSVRVRHNLSRKPDGRKILNEVFGMAILVPNVCWKQTLVYLQTKDILSISGGLTCEDPTHSL